MQKGVYSPFHVCTASAIMVLRKRMHVRGYSICTDLITCKTRQPCLLNNARQPTMLASSVQAVIACNATVPRVCTLVFFIKPFLVLNAPFPLGKGGVVVKTVTHKPFLTPVAPLKTSTLS